jgi:hypothetical protein
VKVLALLANCCLSKEERAYEDELGKRPKLDDDEFFEQFYAASGIPKDIPVRLRKLYKEMLGEEHSALQPQDNLAFIYGEIDFADVLYRVGREFKLKIPLETATKAPLTYKGKSSSTGEIDGTFDSVVRYLAKATRDLTV